MAFIFQPHFNSKCFRVSKTSQKGSLYNYVVVTCSPEYNGIWKYEAKKISGFSSWQNGGVSCYCVPISEYTFLQPLESIKTPEIISKIKKQQHKWVNNTVTNRDYKYAETPDWILK